MKYKKGSKKSFYKNGSKYSPKRYNRPSDYYFKDYKEEWINGILNVEGELRNNFKKFTDKDLWFVTTGGMRMKDFNVFRDGDKVSVSAVSYLLELEGRLENED